MSEFLLDINLKVNGFERDPQIDVKKVGLMNSSMNWLMEFLNYVKNTDKNENFLIMLFTEIIYAWSIKTIELYDKKTHTINPDSMVLSIDRNLAIFVQKKFWRQICPKLIDWLINILINKKIDAVYFHSMTRSLMTLFKKNLIDDNIWFKYETLIESKILSE